LGYEVDCVHGHALANLEILARSPWIKLDDSSAQGWAHMTIHTVLSGALVFATGSIQWSWGLDIARIRESQLASSILAGGNTQLWISSPDVG
jgi:hypothetical protein